MKLFKSKNFELLVLKTLILSLGAFIIVFLFSVVTEAQTNKAGFFSEAFLTYEVGEGDIDYPAPLGKTEVERHGFGLGARAGFHVREIFFVGADGRYSMPRFKTKDSSESSEVSSDAYNIGPTLGVQTPYFGIRVWGTYVLDGALDPKQLSNSVDIKLKDQEGYRIGLGGYIYFVSVNLEYQNAKFGAIDLEKAGGLSGPEDVRGLGLRDEAYILSVSFPIAL